jgi:hypothetical protein
MNRKTILSAVSLSAVALFACGSAGHATNLYPSIGADTLGPALIITLNSNGTATVSNGPSAGHPYDGVEDTYIGVENNTSATVFNITITGDRISGNSIFGFDGDGIGVGPYSGTGIQQYGTVNSFDAAHAANGCTSVGGSGCTGYGGPISFFSNIHTLGLGVDQGTLNFNGGLAANGFTWFALEEPLDAASFTVSTVPGPLAGAGLPGLFAGVACFLGWLRQRRKFA